MIQPSSLFITGTDTGVGKTWMTLGIMWGLQQKGYCITGMKPVASGSRNTGNGLQNDDAIRILEQSSIQHEYKTVNPYTFAPPVAPLFAAAEDGVIIELNLIQQSFNRLSDGADLVVVEGVGGWRMLLGGDCQMADLVRILGLKVVLVVAMRLGCINHAILTAEAIRRDGADLRGWVANCTEQAYEPLVDSCRLISQRIGAPQLGTVPHANTFDVGDIGSHLGLDYIWQGHDVA